MSTVDVQMVRVSAGCYRFWGSVAVIVAIFCSDVLNRPEPHPNDPRIANNLGYVFMVCDNLGKAQELLEIAAAEHEDKRDKALPIYYIGVAKAKKGQLESALVEFRTVTEYLREAERTHRECACLGVPKALEDGGLSFEEVLDPDLLKTAQDATVVVEQFLSK